MSSPFGPMVLVVNPMSGKGRVAAALPAIETRLRTHALEYRVAVTRGPGDATTETRRALEGGERYIVAVGGDGTVHEVVNGMIRDDRPIEPDAVLGVVAAGSGSDFVRTFGLPGDASGGVVHLAGETTRPLDVGKVTYIGADGRDAARYFCNIAEAGLGAAVVARAVRLPRSLGRSQYFFGFWMTMPGFTSAVTRLEADGQTMERRVHNIVVANGRFFGGGMHISPKSEPDDGLLDVLLMVGPKSDSFTTVPKVYKGTHLPHRNIVELRAASVRVEAERPLPIEADGEVLGSTPATFGLLRHAVRVKI